MRFSRFLPALWLLAVPLPASSANLELSAETAMSYDSNVFRREDNVEGDGAVRFTPRALLRSGEGKLGYDLLYAPTFEKFFTTDKADDVSHLVRGRGDYRLSDRTSLFASDSFRVVQTLNAVSGGGVSAPFEGEEEEIPDDDIGRGNIYLNDAEVSLNHSFSPRLISEFNLQHALFDTDANNTSRSQAVSGSGGVSYAYDAKNTLGGGGAVTFQLFDGTETQPRNRSWIYEVFGSWTHRFGEATKLTVRAGPALIFSYQDDVDTTRPDNVAFPHNLVGGNVFGRMLSEIPNLVLLDGQDGSEVITAGSVLIPDPNGSCGMGDTIGVFRVYRPADCPLQSIIIEEDDENPLDAASRVATDMIPLTLNPSFSDSGRNGGRFTFFATVRLTRRWTETLQSSISYRRSQSNVSGLGSTSIRDAVSLNTSWTPSRLWNLALSAQWVQRQSANAVTQSFLVIDDMTVDDVDVLGFTGELVTDKVRRSVDTQRWQVVLRAARRITKHTSATLRLSYADQDSTSQTGNARNRSFQDVVAIVGFRYQFDPIHLY